MFIPSRDDIVRIHRAVMEACGENSREYDGFDQDRLDKHLELAIVFLDDNADAIETAVKLSCQVARSQAFLTGTVGTALVLAAMVLDLNRVALPDRWTDYAELLEAAANRTLSLGEAGDQLRKWLRQAVADKADAARVAALPAWARSLSTLEDNLEEGDT
jgi:hypothetical protein